MNFSELTIAGLLGHHIKGVTARYATAPDSALLAAADRVALRIAETDNARKAFVTLYPNGAPEQGELSNKRLLYAVNKWLKENGFPDAKRDVILRVAGRRSR